MNAKSTAMVKGIDISNNNQAVDFAQVKAVGIGAVYCKATEGTTFKDPLFASYISALKAQGIPFGAYHMLRQTSAAKDQAEEFWKTIQGTGYALVPALDVERIGLKDGKAEDQTFASVKDFLSEFERLSGIKAAIYVSTGYIKGRFDSSVEDHPLWVAHYGVPAPGDNGVWQAYDGWQSSSTGAVPGVIGGVDVDVFCDTLFMGKANAPSQTLASAPQASQLQADAAVLAYQRKLNRLKIAALAEDGILGPKTAEAVVSFEKLMGLSVDAGKWGSQCEAAYNTVAAKPEIRYFKVYCQAARYVQFRIGTAVDGYFGTNSVAALQSWQRKNGLKADGICGANTWGKMIG